MGMFDFFNRRASGPSFSPPPGGYPTPGAAPADSWRGNAIGYAPPPAADQIGMFHQFLNTLGSGIGLLLNRGGAPGVAPSSGVTASAGGWNIDANGNLVSSAPYYSGSQAAHSTHSTAMSALAATNKATNMQRNII